MKSPSQKVPNNITLKTLCVSWLLLTLWGCTFEHAASGARYWSETLGLKDSVNSEGMSSVFHSRTKLLVTSVVPEGTTKGELAEFNTINLELAKALNNEFLVVFHHSPTSDLLVAKQAALSNNCDLLVVPFVVDAGSLERPKEMIIKLYKAEDLGSLIITKLHAKDGLLQWNSNSAWRRKIFATYAASIVTSEKPRS